MATDYPNLTIQTGERKSELLPCPFCGGKAFVSVRLPYFGETFTFAVVCENCNASSKYKTREEDAIKEWNTRTHRMTLCEKCNNDICKVYGGTCRKYRFIRLLRKLFLKGGE